MEIYEKKCKKTFKKIYPNDKGTPLMDQGGFEWWGFS